MTEENHNNFGADIIARVISQQGHCDAGYQVGDQISFCGAAIEGKTSCIHMLTSMLPVVYAMKYGATFPWASDPDITTMACPDHLNPVVFELLRISNAQPPTTA